MKKFNTLIKCLFLLTSLNILANTTDSNDKDIVYVDCKSRAGHHIQTAFSAPKGLLYYDKNNVFIYEEFDKNLIQSQIKVLPDYFNGSLDKSSVELKEVQQTASSTAFNVELFLSSSTSDDWTRITLYQFIDVFHSSDNKGNKTNYVLGTYLDQKSDDLSGVNTHFAEEFRFSMKRDKQTGRFNSNAKLICSASKSPL